MSHLELREPAEQQPATPAYTNGEDVVEAEISIDDIPGRDEEEKWKALR
jgi:hypothetical protein